MRLPTRSAPGAVRSVLYPLGRVSERFIPGEEPIELHATMLPLVFGRKEPNEAPSRGRALVDDPWMSQDHARIIDGARVATSSGKGGASPQRLFIEDLGSKNGIVVNGTRSARAPLLHGDVVELGRTFWVFVEERYSEPVLQSVCEVGAFVTWHPRLGAQLQHLVQRATTADHALIAGEDGTGKGFLARTLHQISRRDGRFLHLDCAERRPRKIAVDLFGKDGVPGRLRDAARGTLLLEHIDALPIELQQRLTEVLRKRIVPTRSSSSGLDNKLEARIVATCTGDPDQHITDGVLDAGFVQQLSSIRVDVLPLSERLCDLGLLLDDFLSRAKGATAISREACRVLFRHRFGQHVRGFARVVEAAASLAAESAPRGAARGGTVSVEHLPFSVAGADAMRALMARAAGLANDFATPDNPELTNHEVPVLSVTGDDVALPDVSSDGGFSSVIETDTDRPRPSMSASTSQKKKRATVSVMDADVFADADEPEPEMLIAALRAAHGNVAAAARALGRPRAIVLRWLRDLGLDPLAYR